MKKILLVVSIILILLIGGGVLAVRFISSSFSGPTTSVNEPGTTDVTSGIVEKNTDVQVSVEKSTKADTIVLKVDGLNKKYATIEYEVTYDSEGLVKGVNSGSKPIDVNTNTSFEREVYLGTCSRNVCKPDTGVKSVSIVLQFIDSANKKTQFTQDFEI